MILKLRERMANREEGFTLIELLVVMLIIGILAAIAIPTFFNQRNKASDSSAKEMAHTGQVAAETIATDNNGSYAHGQPDHAQRDRFVDPDGGRFTAASVRERRERNREQLDHDDHVADRQHVLDRQEPPLAL